MEYVLILEMFIGGIWQQTMPFSYHPNLDACLVERSIVIAIAQNDPKLAPQILRNEARLECYPRKAAPRNAP